PEPVEFARPVPVATEPQSPPLLFQSTLRGYRATAIPFAARTCFHPALQSRPPLEGSAPRPQPLVHSGSPAPGKDTGPVTLPARHMLRYLRRAAAAGATRGRPSTPLQHHGSRGA